MNDLRLEDYIMYAADLGEENPMPDIKNVSYIHATFTASEELNDEEKANIGKGKIRTILPYLIKDDYSRKLQKKKFRSVVLENDYLKAVFLPEVGGRLWSLYDKKANRELLYVNNVFQPGNLAIRNAWVSGGIEFNVGIRGHNPLTCDSVFAAFSKDKEGNPVLSLYEYERIRKIVYSVNAKLDKDRLLLTTVVENTLEKPTWMYWWSNIAVEEKDVRVFVPAESAFVIEYGDDKYNITKKKMPNIEDIDSSYPSGFTHSGDLFYDIPNDELKWEAAIGKDGYGLLEYSSPELKGRKVFFWGNGRGGKRWNEFLSNDKRKYIEIQAGYLKTQMEHILMPEKSVWSWTEVYKAITIPTDLACGDWQLGNEYIKNRILQEYDFVKKPVEISQDKKIVMYGSGWGAFEAQRRTISSFFKFPLEAIDEKQKDWVSLFEKGYIEYRDIWVPPISYYIDENALELLENSTKSEEGNHYLTYLYIGVLKYALGDVSGAMVAFMKSNELTDNPWALRNMAMIFKNEMSNSEAARSSILKAVHLNDFRCHALLKDCAHILTACGGDAEWLTIVERLPYETCSNGRLGLYSVLALMHTGRYFEAADILNEKFELNDIKEGEVSVSAIWEELYREIEKRGGEYIPLPQKLDFRMV